MYVYIYIYMYIYIWDMLDDFVGTALHHFGSTAFPSDVSHVALTLRRAPKAVGPQSIACRNACKKVAEFFGFW